MAHQGQIFDIVRQGHGGLRYQRIDTRAGVFDDDNIRAVDHVGVVTQPADQGVSAVPAGQDIIQSVARAGETVDRGQGGT